MNFTAGLAFARIRNMRGRGPDLPHFHWLTFGLFASAVLVACVSLGCIGYLPETVALVPGAASVELVSDPPNVDVYEPAGEVNAQVVGKETGEALRQAANELRNQAAKRGATFVSIEEVSSRAAWDFSGRVIVSMSGTAFKVK